MFRYCEIFFIVLSCVSVSLSQDNQFTPIYNTSYSNFRLNNRAPEDTHSSEPNLWLISRDDPIPESLDGQILTRSYILNGQQASVHNNDQGIRLSHPNSNGNIESAPVFQQSQVDPISQASLPYNRIVTSENRRQSFDGNERGIHNSEAVLVQLPLEVTEGLWVRPQSEHFHQPNVRGRQNTDGLDANIQFDGFVRPNEQDTSNFVPVREPTSRLPNAEFPPQPEFNIPQEQFRGLPFQIVAEFQVPNGINTSTNAHQDFDAPKILLFNNEQNPIYGNNTTPRYYELPVIDASTGNAQAYELKVLTNEDIEILEKLGILSSVIGEPIQSTNANNFTATGHSRREYENEPVLIDNGGQVFLRNDGRESAYLDDVVLIDIPQFTTSEYHSDVPENVGNRGDGQLPEIYKSENVPENHFSQNEKYNVQNDTDLTDRQILEILQILSLNGGDLFNLSSPMPAKTEIKVSENSSYDNSSEMRDPQTSNSSIVQGKNMHSTSFKTDVPSSFLKSLNIGTQQVSTEQPTSESPSVSNGRIQPRLLEKLTVKDNEIIEKLFAKAVPVSEGKIEILKKLQDQAKPYVFGFNQDDGNGTLQHRNEKADALGVVKGTYGYRDALGVYRNVSYIADSNGFHAVVKTNEPGTVSHKAADVVFMSQTPPLGALIKMMAYRRSKEASNTTITP